MPLEKIIEKGTFQRELLILTRGVAATVPPQTHLARVMDIVKRLDDPVIYKKACPAL
jgi:hypothetical protein